MKLAILCAPALLLLAACGGGGSSPGTGTGVFPTGGGKAAATTTPAQQWKATPGQRDKVVTLLTSKTYACSSMDGDGGFSFTVCAKPPEGTVSKNLDWMKFVAAADGTVVHVLSNGARYHRDGLAAIMGEKDAGIFVAGGKNLSWGTTDGTGVSVLGLTAVPAPPRPAGFGLAKEDVLAIYQPDPAMNCRITDPTPAPPNRHPWPTQYPSPTPSVAPAPTSLLSCIRQPQDDYAAEVSIAAVGTGSEVTGLELFVEQTADSPEDDPHKGPQYYPDEVVFAKAKPALLAQTAKLWPALKGPDAAAIRSWAEQHIAFNRNSLGYVAGHRVEVVSYRNVNYAIYQIRVTIGPEQPDLAEPNR